MRQGERRGGQRRPVDVFRFERRLGGWSAAVVAWLLLLASPVVAHGGVPVVQLNAERVRPGETVEVRADMTSQGAFDVFLLAPASAQSWSLGAFEADYESHVQLFVVVPIDVPAGSYRITARNEREEASAPLEVAGAAVGGQEGQLPGQDEARAPVASAEAAGPATGSPTSTSLAGRDDGGNLLVAGVVVVSGVALALLIGLASRTRARPREPR